MKRKRCAGIGCIAIALFLIFNTTYLCAADKLPFEADDTLEEIRAKIKHNGYSFTVEHNRIFDLPLPVRLRARQLRRGISRLCL